MTYRFITIPKNSLTLCHILNVHLTFDNPDFGALAKSLNMWGIQINSADEFLPALKEAFKQKGPAIIGVPVDYSENMRLTKHLGKVSQVL